MLRSVGFTLEFSERFEHLKHPREGASLGGICADFPETAWLMSSSFSTSLNALASSGGNKGGSYSARIRACVSRSRLRLFLPHLVVAERWNRTDRFATRDPSQPAQIQLAPAGGPFGHQEHAVELEQAEPRWWNARGEVQVYPRDRSRRVPRHPRQTLLHRNSRTRIAGSLSFFEASPHRNASQPGNIQAVSY